MNNQGTKTVDDDKVVGGATFEFRQDDGDGKYEPTGDDSPVLATVDSQHGFAVYTPSELGDYWVTEASPPTGLDTAPPQLVTYTGSAENCGVTGKKSKCVADDDGSGGFTLVLIVDAPTGGVAGAGKGGPPTDVVEPESGDASPTVWIVVISLLAGAFAFAAAFRRLGDRRRG